MALSQNELMKLVIVKSFIMTLSQKNADQYWWLMRL